MRSITLGEYLTRREQGEGYCRECEEFTRDGVTANAKKNACPECDTRGVYGVDAAIRAKHLEIQEEATE